MARGGRRTNYVRDASGRFASTPGGGSAASAKAGGGGLAAARKKSRPSASKSSLASLRKSTPTPVPDQPKKRATKASPAQSKQLKQVKPAARTSKAVSPKVAEQKPKATRKKQATPPIDATPKQQAPQPNARKKSAATKPVNQPTPSQPPQKKASSRVASKTLRQARIATNRGMLKGRSVEKAAVNKALRKEEGRIRDQGVEHAVIVNKRGRVLHRGTENSATSVRLGKQGKIYNYGFAATHNHPETGNPGYNPKVKGSSLTAGLSYGDLRAGIVRAASQIRAVGKTRSYSYKPDLINKPGVGLVANVRDTFNNELKNAFSYGMDKRRAAAVNTERKFRERIEKAQSQWWNPMARGKVKKLKAMQARAMEALSATAHYQDQANAMRELRKLGYNITARRNRDLNLSGLTTPSKRRRRW